MISGAFKKISSKFVDEKNGPIASNPFADYVRKVSEQILKPVVKKKENILFIRAALVDHQIGLLCHG